MVTPMKEDGAVNYPVFRELLEMQVENKADAVVIAGTTGEGSTLSDQEHIELVKFAVHEIRGRIPVIAGAGSNNTAHAVYLSRECAVSYTHLDVYKRQACCFVLDNSGDFQHTARQIDQRMRQYEIM